MLRRTNDRTVGCRLVEGHFSVSSPESRFVFSERLLELLSVSWMVQVLSVVNTTGAIVEVSISLAGFFATNGFHSDSVRFIMVGQNVESAMGLVHLAHVGG